MLLASLKWSSTNHHRANLAFHDLALDIVLRNLVFNLLYRAVAYHVSGKTLLDGIRRILNHFYKLQFL